ncbi:MAG TPA: hypothetical protein VI357_10585 [Mycobacteriales bacterium]
MAGLSVTVGVVLAGSILQFVGFGFFHNRVTALNSASDGGLFGFAGRLAIASAAFASWMVLLRLRPVTPALVVLPPVFTFLAADEVWRLHRLIGVGLVFYLPVLLAAFLATFAVARSLSPVSFRLCIVALALLGASFLIHQFGEQLLFQLGASSGGWLFQVKAVVKHGAEVAGWLLMTLAFAVSLRDHSKRPESGL